MALTLSLLAINPFLLAVKPNILNFGLHISHFAGWRVRKCFSRRSNNADIIMGNVFFKCVAEHNEIIEVSKYICESSYYYNNFASLMNVIGAPCRPNGIELHSNKPCFVMNAVFCLSFVLIGTDQ